MRQLCILAWMPAYPRSGLYLNQYLNQFPTWPSLFKNVLQLDSWHGFNRFRNCAVRHARRIHTLLVLLKIWIAFTEYSALIVQKILTVNNAVRHIYQVHLVKSSLHVPVFFLLADIMVSRAWVRTNASHCDIKRAVETLDVPETFIV